MSEFGKEIKHEKERNARRPWRLRRFSRTRPRQTHKLPSHLMKAAMEISPMKPRPGTETASDFI
jgi:hypothetical protein